MSHCEAQVNGVITTIVLDSGNEVVSASFTGDKGLDVVASETPEQTGVCRETT